MDKAFQKIVALLAHFCNVTLNCGAISRIAREKNGTKVTRINPCAATHKCFDKINGYVYYYMLIYLYQLNSSSSGKFSLFKLVDVDYGSYNAYFPPMCLFIPILYLSTTFYVSEMTSEQ